MLNTLTDFVFISKINLLFLIYISDMCHHSIGNDSWYTNGIRQVF
jgi:hypothetical protein